MRYRLPLLLIPLLACLSCTREEARQQDITIVATTGVPSKASLYAAGPLSPDVSLGLLSFKYTSSNADPSQWRRHYVYRAEYDAASGKWMAASGSQLLWPGDGFFIRFYAYAPYDAAGLTVSSPNGALPTFRYTVPAPQRQCDLLLSDTGSSREYPGDPGWRRTDVTLNMVHALTAIRFRVIEGLYITRIRVMGIRNSGVVDYSTQELWGSLSGNASYTITDLSPGNGLHPDTEKPGYHVIDDDKVLLLMPQILPEGAKIEALVTYMGMTRTIEVSIAGFYWGPGQMITYTITSNPLPNFTEGYSVDYPDIWK